MALKKPGAPRSKEPCSCRPFGWLFVCLFDIYIYIDSTYIKLHFLNIDMYIISNNMIYVWTTCANFCSIVTRLIVCLYLNGRGPLDVHSSAGKRTRKPTQIRARTSCLISCVEDHEVALSW